MPSATNLLRSATIAAIGGIGALLVLYAWHLPPFTSSVETTENAYVRGQVTVISPQIASYVTGVTARDFQTVKAGDVLFTIDSRVYEQRLKQAEATLAMKEAALSNSEQSQRSAEARIRSSEAQLEGASATLEVAQSTAHRTETLLQRGVSTQSAGDQTRSALAKAEADHSAATAAVEVGRQDLRTIAVNRDSLKAEITNAQAAVQLARIDLDNTRVRAPADGKLGEVGVRLGQYVSAGSQLAALVPAWKWVVANFKETQLFGMQLSQQVTFTVDALQDAQLSGRIEEFSPATGSEFSVLKADNATGNFTKVAQRLPVRIAIEPGQPLADHLVPGMSVVVSVDKEKNGTRRAESGVASIRAEQATVGR